MTSLYVRLPLSRAARQDPQMAIPRLFHALTTVKALQYNLVSPTVSEVFFDHQLLPTVLDALSNERHNYLVPQNEIPPVLSPNDFKRRVASYNRSYFPALRHASLLHFSAQHQLALLELAAAAVPRLPPERRPAVLRAIRQDQEIVLTTLRAAPSVPPQDAAMPVAGPDDPAL